VKSFEDYCKYHYTASLSYFIFEPQVMKTWKKEDLLCSLHAELGTKIAAIYFSADG